MAVYPVDERTSRIYTVTVRDENGQLFDGDAFTSLTLKLYDVATDTIINNRDSQNILNMNGVTVTAQGRLTWVMEELDAVIVTPTAHFELHRALFTGLWNPGVGTRTWRREVEFLVRNLHRVS